MIGLEHNLLLTHDQLSPTLCSEVRKASRGTAPLSRGFGLDSSGTSSISLFRFLLGATGAGLGTNYTHKKKLCYYSQEVVRPVLFFWYVSEVLFNVNSACQFLSKDDHRNFGTVYISY